MENIATEIKHFDMSKISENINSGIKMGLAKAELNHLPQTIQEAVAWSGSYHAIAQAIKLNNSKKTEHYLIVGCLLTKAEKQQIHKHDGTMAKNFFEWCDMEAGIKRTSAQRMMKVYSAFKKYFDSFSDLILSVDATKLALIAPYCEKMSDDDAIEMIHSAETNSYRALEANLAELDGKIAKDMCDHNGTLEVWHRCPDCGKFIKVEV